MRAIMATPLRARCRSGGSVATTTWQEPRSSSPRVPTTSSPGLMTAVAEQAKLNVLLEQLPGLVSADSDLVRRGALCNTALEVGIGETLFYVRIAAGRVVALERQPSPPRHVQFSLHA